MKNEKRKPVISVTINDCDVDTFRGSGPGGQLRNKVSSGVRITHRASGAVGKATEDRSQIVNKRNAWQRMCETPKFQSWIRMAHAKKMGQETTEQRVERQMAPWNLKTEVMTDEQKWVERKPEELTDVDESGGA